MRWVEHAAHMGEMRSAYRIFDLLSLNGRDHSEDRCRWEDNVKMDPRKIGFGSVDWIHMGPQG
jgi:hypothetical protein